MKTNKIHKVWYTIYAYIKDWVSPDIDKTKILYSNDLDALNENYEPVEITEQEVLNWLLSHEELDQLLNN